ncbi:MAG: GNAT family N-acetyltransferase [Gemmatimonadota bacterium]
MTPTPTGTAVQIRPATSLDHESIWAIFHEIVERGDTYAFDPGTTREAALAAWCGPQVRTYVASVDGRIVGTSILRPNQPGLGDHVANAGYMVAGTAAGRGVGAALCLHSLEEARRLGFGAMQFNFVVSTNERAVQLWQRLGFAIVGTVPRAFRHATLGPVDVHVMYRTLEPADASLR